MTETRRIYIDGKYIEQELDEGILSETEFKHIGDGIFVEESPVVMNSADSEEVDQEPVF